MLINKLSLGPKGICYECKINLDTYSNPQLDETKLLYKTLSKSHMIKQLKTNILDCKLFVKYSNVNIDKITNIIDETKKYLSNIVLEINTSTQSTLLNSILELNCFNEIVLEKRYFSMDTFKNISNVKTVKYLNHFYSNIKLLPNKIELLEINIKHNSNIFIELPEELECIEYNNSHSNKLSNIELRNYNVGSILFVNSNTNIFSTELFETESLILNTNNNCIDFRNLPNKIKIIYFEAGYKINGYELDYLPNSVKELSFDLENDFKFKENTFMNLPSSVKKINFVSQNYNDFEYFPILPDNIEYIDINFGTTKHISTLNGIINFKIKILPRKIKQIQITTSSGIKNFSPNLINEFNKYINSSNKFDLIIKSIFD